MGPGYRVRPPETPEPARRRDRPRKEVPEAALDLGKKRFRRCDSKRRIACEERIAAMERKIVCLQALSSLRAPENARGENAVQAEEDNRRDVEIPEEDWVLPERPVPEFPEFPEFPRIPESHEFTNLDFLELEQNRTEADLRRFLGE